MSRRAVMSTSPLYQASRMAGSLAMSDSACRDSGRRRVPLATPDEIAAYLKKSEQTLANWRSLGKGPRYTKVGHGVRYTWADVDKWVAGRPSGGGRDRLGRGLQNHQPCL